MKIKPVFQETGFLAITLGSDAGKPYLSGEYSSLHLQGARVILISGTLGVGFNVIVMYREMKDERIDP